MTSMNIPRRFLVFLLPCFIPLIFGIAFASEAQERHAFVIGNSAYAHANVLPNALNDAVDVASALERAGWSVELVTDAGIREMIRSLRLFCEEASGSDSALFFFAGHGIEVKGENYLLPVDAELNDLDREDSLPLETLSLEKVLDDLAEAKIRLKTVVLDCCRDDPLSRSWLATRGNKGGLAEVAESDLPRGAMLVFSTAPGQTAADGRDRNSPFTSALLKRMNAGGGSIADIFGDVASALGAQQPAWIRFDGSGISFTAFRDYLLVPVKNSPPVSPSVTSADVAGMEKQIEALKAEIRSKQQTESEVSALQETINEMETELKAARMGSAFSSTNPSSPVSPPENPKVTVAGVEMEITQLIQTSSDLTMNATIRNTSQSPVSVYAGNTNPHTYFDFRDDLSQYQLLEGHLLGNNGDRFRLLNVSGMNTVDQTRDSSALFRGQNYFLKLAPSEKASLVIEFGARGTDQYSHGAGVHTVSGILETRIVSHGSQPTVSSKGFGFTNLALTNRN